MYKVFLRYRKRLNPHLYPKSDKMIMDEIIKEFSPHLNSKENDSISELTNDSISELIKDSISTTNALIDDLTNTIITDIATQTEIPFIKNNTEIHYYDSKKNKFIIQTPTERYQLSEKPTQHQNEIFTFFVLFNINDPLITTTDIKNIIYTILKLLITDL